MGTKLLGLCKRSNIEHLIGTNSSQQAIISDQAFPNLKTIDLKGGEDKITLGKKQNTIVNIHSKDHLTLSQNVASSKRQDDVKQEPYDLKVNILPGEKGVTTINLHNNEVVGWITLPYTVQQLSGIKYTPVTQVLTLNFSGPLVKIHQFSVEKHSEISFVLKDHLELEATVIFKPIIPHHDKRGKQVIKDIFLNINIPKELTAEQSEQLKSNLSTFTKENFQVRIIAQTQDTKYIIETHQNKHFISIKQPEEVNKKEIYISFAAGNDIYMVDDFNNIEIDSKVTVDTTSDSIIFALSKPVKLRAVKHGNYTIINYSDLPFSSYEKNKPTTQPPYEKTQILDWSNVEAKDIRFTKSNHNINITAGNNSKIVPTWDNGSNYRLTILTKEGNRQKKLLDFRECTSEQVLLQPHLVLNKQLDLSSCNHYLANKIYEFFQSCSDLCISTPNFPGRIKIKNNGNQDFKIVHNNNIYNIKIRDNKVSLEKTSSETYFILVPKQQNVFIKVVITLNANELTAFNALAIPQISKTSDIEFYRTKDHLNLILKLPGFIQPVTITNFYNSKFAQQLVAIKLQREQISNKQLQDKLQQAVKNIVLDLNPDEQQRNTDITEINSTNGTIIINIHKAEGTLQKEGSYFLVTAKSTTSNGVNIIKIPQDANYPVITKDGIYDLNKCMADKINDTILLNSSPDQQYQKECIIISFTSPARHKRDLIGKQDSIGGAFEQESTQIKQYDIVFTDDIQHEEEYKDNYAEI